MNQDLLDYIKGLIKQEIDSEDLITLDQRRMIVGYLLSDEASSLSFLTENEKDSEKFIHKLICYLLKSASSSRLEVWIFFEDVLFKYYEEKIIDIFDKVKVDRVGAHSNDNEVENYSDRRGEG